MDPIIKKAVYNYLEQNAEGILMSSREKSWSIGSPHFSKEVREPGTLDFIISKVRQEFSQMSNPVEIAADIVYQVIRNHPFWDCNHRTATILALTVLKYFDIRLTVTEEDLEKFIKKVDVIDSFDEVYRWFRGAVDELT